MSQQELLAHVAAVLRRLGIPAMLTGSFASSFQGQPRSTHDVDLVIELSGAQVRPLLGAFPPPRYYLEEQAIRDALDRGAMFNLLDSETGDKCDFWLLTDAPFDLERFSRRTTIDYHGTKLDISTPEDTILKKLEWARELGGSEKQLTDVRQIVHAQRGRLDLVYIEHWAARLGVSRAWESVRLDIGGEE